MDPDAWINGGLRECVGKVREIGVILDALCPCSLLHYSRTLWLQADIIFILKIFVSALERMSGGATAETMKDSCRVFSRQRDRGRGTPRRVDREV